MKGKQKIIGLFTLALALAIGGGAIAALPFNGAERSVDGGTIPLAYAYELDNVQEHTHTEEDHDGVDWKPLETTDIGKPGQKMFVITEDGKYYLDKMNAEDTHKIEEDITGKVILCLNGHKPKFDEPIVVSSGTLCICDCTGAGEITCNIVLEDNASLELDGIAVNGSVTVSGATLTVEGKTTIDSVIFSDGTIQCGALDEDAQINVVDESKDESGFPYIDEDSFYGNNAGHEVWDFFTTGEEEQPMPAAAMVEWTDWTDIVYSGEDQQAELKTHVTVKKSNGEEISDFEFSFSIEEGDNPTEFKNAGEYTVSVTFGEDLDGYYEAVGVDGSPGTHTYTIGKAKLDITEKITEKVEYSGEGQEPTTLEVSGVEADGTLKKGTDYRFNYKKTGTGDPSSELPLDAGEYTVYLELLNDAETNYNPIEDSVGTFTIDKATLTISLLDNQTYNGEDHNTNGDIAKEIAGHMENSETEVVPQKDTEYIITIESPSTVVKNAGEYTVKVTLTELGKKNFQFDDEGKEYDECTYTVDPAKIEVPTLKGVTYSGGVQSAAELNTSFETHVNNESLKIKDDYTVSYQGSVPANTEPKNADTYTVTVKLTDSAAAKNYTLSKDTAEYIIAKAKITLSGTYSAEKVYDGTPYSQTVKATGNGLSVIMTPSDPMFEIAIKTSEKDANTYTGNITEVTYDENNFELDNTAKYSVTITQATAAVEWSGDEGLTYSGKPQEPTAKATGVGEETVVLTVVYTSNTEGTELVGGKPQNAGSYTATASTANGNYILKDESKTFTIGKATLGALTWNDAENHVYDGREHNPSATASGVNGETLTLTVGMTAPEETVCRNAGTYTFSAELSEADRKNYEFGEGVDLKKTVVISQKTVENIDWKGGPYTYTGEKITELPTASFTGEGSDGTIELNVTQETAGDFKDAKTYTFRAELEGINAQNYTLQTPTHDFTVAKAKITVSGTFAAEKEYDGSPYSATVKTSGNGLNVEMPVQDGSFEIAVKTSGKDANTYTGSIQEDDVTYDSANFELVINGAGYSIEIKQKVLQTSAIEWGSLTFEYDGSAHKPAATIDTGVGDEGAITLEVSVSGVGLTNGEAINANVGGAKYTATATLPASASNYALGEATKEFTVTPQAVEVEWSGLNLTYNGKEQQPTAAATDKQTNSVALTVTVEGEHTAVGAYRATATTSDANYTLTNATVEFEIVACEIELSAEEKTEIEGYVTKSKVYDGNTAAAAEASKDSLEHGGVQAKFILSASYNDKNVSKANTITVTVTLADTTNFTFKDSASGAYTVEGNAIFWTIDEGVSITPKPLEVAFEGLTTAYTGAAQAPTATAETNVGSETVTLTVTLSNGSTGRLTGGEAIDAGVYTATAAITGASSDTETGNYSLTNATSDFTIAQAENGWKTELDIKNWTYGDAANAPAAEANFGEVTFTYSEKDGSPLTGAPTNAGDYIVTATVQSTDNYKGLTAEKEFAVNRAHLTAKLSASVVYGEAIGEGNVTVTVEEGELKNGDDREKITREAFEAAKEFFRYGNYRAGVTGVEATKEIVSVNTGDHSVSIENYIVTFEDGEITVERRKIDITLSGGRSNIYGDEAHGTIAVSATHNGSENWFGSEADRTLLEEEKGLSFTFRSGEGAAKNYDPRMAAGKYTVVVALAGDLAKNYELLNTEGTEYTVTPRALTLTVTAEVVYGDELTEDNVTLALKAGSTLVSGDNLTDILAAAKDAAHFDFDGYTKGTTGVGDSLTITAATAEIANYTVTFESVAGNLTVKPREITVTVGGKLQHTYGNTPARPAFGTDGETDPTLSAVRTNGEGEWYGNEADIAALASRAVYALVNGGSHAFDASAPAGSYTLTLTWENENYTVTVVGGTYTVERAALTASLTASVTYGDGQGGIDVTVTVDEHDLKNGDDKSAIEAAAKRAATFDYGDYAAGTPVSRGDISVSAAAAELENYTVTYTDCTLEIKQREITVKIAGEGRGEYTGEGQEIAVEFENVFSEDALALDADYTIAYSAGGEGSLNGSLPLTAGRYYAEVALTSSERAANYTITGGVRFEYEITPAKIIESFQEGFAKDRSALYSADSSRAQPPELPEQGDPNFPLVLKGEGNTVTLRYILLTHKEDSSEHANFVGKIADYLRQLEGGAQALDGKGYQNHIDSVTAPGGYCVFFEAKAPNHETYYGYFTLHIYHEQLTIKMKAGGLNFTSEYGDVPHTYDTLFELVFAQIESITATAEDGSLSENKYEQFKEEKDFFHFYFTAGGREYLIEDLLDVGTYTLNVRYSKTGAEGAEDSFIEFIWEGGHAPTMEVTPRVLLITLGGEKTHEYGAEIFGSIEPTVSFKNPHNNEVNGEGLFGEDTVAGLNLAYTFALGEWTGALDRKMGVGTYTVSVTCGNGNYTVEEVKDATYEVTPKELTVTVTAEVVYGDELEAENVKAEIAAGLTSWDEGERAKITAEALAAGAYTLVNYTPGTTQAGDRSVSVHAERVAVGNYTVIYVSGGVTVKPRTVKVTLSGGTNVYGAAQHGAITAIAVRTDGEGNAIAGDWRGNESDTLDFTYRFQAAGGEAAAYFPTMGAGSYTVVIEWENGNYEIVAVEGAEYTVTPAELTFEVPEGGQYDARARKLLETIEGVAGEVLRRGTDYNVFYNGAEYDGHSDGLLPKDAGSYTVKIELTGKASENYSLAKESFTYIITQCELEKPTGSDLTVDYNGEDRELTVEGFDGATMTAEGSNADPWTAKVTAKNAGKYTVTVSISDLTNYCWSGGGQESVSFTLTVSPVDIVENEKFHDFEEREFLYHASGESHSLALPGQSNVNFPFDVPGGGAVKVSYIVKTHEENAHDPSAIEAYLRELEAGADEGLWHSANAAMYVNTPKGYCVYFKIEDESGNHNTYYGYYSVHIYHEEITIYLDESVVDGHFDNVEYGDAAHTQDVLRDRLYAHIKEVKAGMEPEEGTALEGRLDKRYFNFYLIDEAGAEHYLGETDSGDRLPVGKYKIGIRYLKDGEESRYILFHWHDDVQPDFTIVPRRIDLTVSFEGHVYGEAPKALAEQAALSAVRSNGKRGDWFGKRGETFEDLLLSYSLKDGAAPSAAMNAGTYFAAAAWENANYEVTFVNAAGGELTYTVEKASVEKPEEDGTEFVYTGEAQTYELSESDRYTVAGGNVQTNANPSGYDVTIRLTDPANYKWKDGDSGDLIYKFIIKKAILTVTAGDGTVTYGEAAPAGDAECSGFLGGDDEGVLSGALAFDFGGYEPFKDVGEYPITPSGLFADNYEFAYVAGTLTVVPKEISAEWGEKSYTYTGSVLTDLPAATAEGIGEDGTLTLKVSPAFTGEFRNAGAYTFEAELEGSAAKAKNYTLKEDTKTHVYIVEKLELSPPAIASKVYCGKLQTADVAPSSFYTVAENNGGIDAGDYDVRLALRDGANCKWAGSERTEIVLVFTIAKADYDMSGVTFEDLTSYYDGKPHGIEIGGTLPEGVTVTYEGNGQTAIGEYTVTANFAGDTRNYNPIPSKKATLKILAVSHDLGGIVFEDVTVKYDGSAHGITVRGTLPQGVSVSYEGNGKIDPNVYTVVAVFSDPDGEFERRTATLTILRTHAQFDLDSDGEAEVLLESEEGFDPTLELFAEETESVSRTYWVWEKDRVSEKYTVKLRRGGAEAPFGGKVTVRLLIPEAFRERDFELRTEGGSERVAFTRDGDYVVFEADGLSAYVLTSDYAPYIPTVIIMAAVLLIDVLSMAALAYVWKKRKNTAEE